MFMNKSFVLLKKQKNNNSTFRVWPVHDKWSQSVILAPCNYPWSTLGPRLAQISPASYASPTSNPTDKKRLEVEECHPLPKKPIISSPAALQPVPRLCGWWGCCGWMSEVRQSQAPTTRSFALQLNTEIFNMKRTVCVRRQQHSD